MTAPGRIPVRCRKLVNRWLPVLCLAGLAGCGVAWPNSGPGLGAAGAGAGGAANTGAAAAASSGDAAQCRALAEDAVQTETGINEDIAATRRNDWERAEVLPEQAGMLRDSTADRARAIFETCMSSAARPAAVH